jgi:hypothetical protein
MMMAPLLLGGVVASGTVAITPQPSDGETSYEIMLSVPVGGPEGLSYFGGLVDMQKTGPTSFDISEDGTFWFGDNEAKRVRQYDRGGKLVRTVDFTDEVAGIADLEVDAASVTVLDVAASNPGILRKEIVSGRKSIVELPKDVFFTADGAVAVTGLVRDSGRNVVAERLGGKDFAPLADANGKTNLGPVGSRIGFLAHHGRSFAVGGGDPSTGDLSGEVVVNGKARSIEPLPSNFVGGVEFLGANRGGDYWTRVDEVNMTGDVVRVTQTVRQFSASGKLLGTATVPLDEREMHVDHGVQIGPDGEVYAMVPRKSSVDIVRLPVVAPGLTPPLVASPSQAPANPETVLTDAVPIHHMQCSDTTHVASTWSSYHNNSVSLSNHAINGACSGRTKPRYLGGAGTYGSVSYDWGGWDTVAGFNNAMAAGSQAGDIHTAASEGCSKGVDCSGYVGRVWQHNEMKYGTATLPNISHALSGTSRLVLWDIFNKSGSHTLLFIGFSGNGFAGSESTITASYDRVVYRVIDWGYVNGYSLRRSNKLSGCYPT